MINFPLWPPQASTQATQVDILYIYLLLLSGAIATGIFLALVFFSVKYRRGSLANRTNPPHGNLLIEWTWIIVPLMLALATFLWGAVVYIRMARVPSDAMDVQVIGKQWMFKTQHPSGQREINELHVPAGRPIRLTMVSQDVIHSFYIPAFRIKQDVLPGRYTTIWFTPTRTGTYLLHCAEYCGTEHAEMGGHVIVMDPADYERWLAGGNQQQGLVQEGAALFRQYGCSGCHGPSATVHAPKLEGVYGKPVPLQDGRVVVADDQYLRDSILLPRRDIAAGYPPIMPSFQGQITEEDLLKIVTYIKSLGVSSERTGSQP
jgi:cytochrome c oxidase subunit 2